MILLYGGFTAHHQHHLSRIYGREPMHNVVTLCAPVLSPEHVARVLTSAKLFPRYVFVAVLVKGSTRYQALSNAPNVIIEEHGENEVTGRTRYERLAALGRRVQHDSAHTQVADNQTV